MESTVTAVFRADISDMSGKMDRLSSSVKNLDDGLGRAGKGFGGLKSALGRMNPGAMIGMFDGFIQGAVGAATEAQKAGARLDQISRSMGVMDTVLGGSTDRLKEFASTLSQTIGVEDETIMQGQALLMTFQSVASSAGEAGGMFDRAMTAAADLAAAGFGNLTGNSRQLGRALEDPIRGMNSLRRSGVTLTEAEKEQIKTFMEAGEQLKAQEVVMKAVEKQTGGAAAAIVTDAEKMKLAFGELQETIGVALFPIMEELSKSLTPVIKNLEGPLGGLAEMIGTVLKDAMDAIAPVLPDFTTAITEIGKAFSTLLSGALKAIIPILQPMLVLFADIAERVGPLLTPLLEKLGVVFGKLIAAVMPLIEPLVELVFTILDAAMPIITTVADVLGVLIDAFAPLFPIVAQLLKPLGQLINVVLVALMPVIKPLLPVIEALAKVFADVLARAIGLIITTTGGLIVGWSKLAPFVLNNVAIPVMEYFLDMAEDIIKSARLAFSWIPGLDEKLAGAETAIGNFKTQATKAVSAAATAISTEGEKIGKGLIDQGILAMTDPAKATALATESKKIGQAMATGMERGLLSRKPQVIQAAGDMASDAAREAKLRLAIASPSGVFMQIGRDSGEGFRIGIEQSRAAAVGAMMIIGRDVISAFVKGMQEKDPEAREQARQTMKDSVTAAYEEVVSRLRSDVQTIKDEMQSFGQSVQSAIMTGIDFGAAFEKVGTQGGMSFMQALQKQAEDAILFAQRVEALLNMGMSQEALQYVLAQAGSSGSAIAQMLIDGGTTAIDNATGLVDSARAAAERVAILAGDAYYGTGLQTAQDTLAGFMSSFGPGGGGRAAILAAMDSLAASMNRTATITVRTVYETVGSPPNTNPPGRAAGGPVRAGSMYLVGERGPELFVSNSAGRIIPNHALMSNDLGRMGSYLASSNVPSGQGGDGAASKVAVNNTFNVSVNAGMGSDGREIGRVIVEQIKRFERTNGPVFASA